MPSGWRIVGVGVIAALAVAGLLACGLTHVAPRSAPVAIGAPIEAIVLCGYVDDHGDAQILTAQALLGQSARSWAGPLTLLIMVVGFSLLIWSSEDRE